MSVPQFLQKRWPPTRAQHVISKMHIKQLVMQALRAMLTPQRVIKFLPAQLMRREDSAAATLAGRKP